MTKLSELLDDWLREVFEERAAIREFDGGLPKEKAEALAKAEMETYIKHMAEKGKE